MIRLGMFLPPCADHRWRLAAQAGVCNAISRLNPVYDAWKMDSLTQAKKAFSAGGFELCALEGDPMDMNRIKLGLPGRDEDLARYCRMLQNMGELGIRILCYNFMAGIGWFRSRTSIPCRGGALTSGFFASDVPSEPLKLSHEELWQNYEYFIRAVLPAAEKAGVRMSLHPDDPPVSELKGYPRIFTSAEAFRKMLRMTGSPNAGITFCAATFRTMGEDDLALLEEWKSHISFVHMRDNRPCGDGFIETFHDEGPTDLYSRLAKIHELDMRVLLRPDHAPTMDGEDNSEPGYAAMGRIFAVGYLRGIMESLKMEEGRCRDFRGEDFNDMRMRKDDLKRKQSRGSKKRIGSPKEPVGSL